MLNLSKIKEAPIVIDEAKNLIFQNEEDLFKHFEASIQFLEKEYESLRISSDFTENEIKSYEKFLADTLEFPDEIWKDTTTISGENLSIYIKEIDGEIMGPTAGESLSGEKSNREGNEEQSFFYVAICYVTDKIPSFVYLHFPTGHLETVEKYQRGEIIYDRILEEAPLGAIEGDALVEKDELAYGLYKAMLLLRAEDDIPETDFRSFANYRESAIEEADEIWRSNDSFGNVLVYFIKDFSDELPKGLHYVVATVEDSPSGTHSLLFSFPTKDIHLVSRYRQGENLQADEVLQESSH